MKLDRYDVGLDRPLLLIAGPCVIESQALVDEIAGHMVELTRRLGVNYVFKASFDKANRSSGTSFRGPGIDQGLKVLEGVRRQYGVPVITDVHEDTPLNEVASVVVLQTPAFLARKTSVIQRVAAAGKPVHVKRGQFMAPWDMSDVVAKFREAGNEDVMLCERGACFGYDAIVSDMQALEVMKQTGRPVVFDATHSVQQPGGFGPTGMQRALVPTLARAAVAVGVAGIFLETHPDPDNALSDGPNMWPLGWMEELLTVLLELARRSRVCCCLPACRSRLARKRVHHARRGTILAHHAQLADRRALCRPSWVASIRIAGRGMRCVPRSPWPLIREGAKSYSSSTANPRSGRSPIPFTDSRRAPARRPHCAPRSCPMRATGRRSPHRTAARGGGAANRLTRCSCGVQPTDSRPRALQSRTVG